MSIIQSSLKTEPRTGADRVFKLIAMLFLPLLVAAVAACDNGPTPSPTPTATSTGPVATATASPTATNSQAPYNGRPEGKPRYNQSNQPDMQEALETKAAGELPSFVLAMQGPTRDAVIADYKGAVDHLVDYSHIPCYCGCAMYEHPHSSLASCFVKEVKSDGQLVFTDHSTTCDICQGVADMTVKGLASHQSLLDIRAAVYKKYKFTGTWTDTPTP